MEARTRDAERHSDVAGAALDDAQKAADAADPPAMERSLEEARKALSTPDINLYPDTGLQQERYRELAAKLPEVRREREKRDLEKRVKAAQDRMVPRVAALAQAVDDFVLATATKEAIASLEELAADVKKGLEEEKYLTEKDRGFAQWAQTQHGKIDQALESAAKGKKAVAFLDGPVAAMKEGAALHKEARAKKAVEDRALTLADARLRLRTCQKDAASAATDAALASVSFPLSGKGQTPAQVAKMCKAELVFVEREWRTAAAAAAAGAKRSKKKRA